jgi:hypothetical protein
VLEKVRGQERGRVSSQTEEARQVQREVDNITVFSLQNDYDMTSAVGTCKPVFLVT